jgi:hypothetical protein
VRLVLILVESVAKIQRQQHAPPRKIGRPTVGSYRLETMLPAQVLKELMREEAASGVYRTRVAANVLCNWAKQQRAQ